MSGVAPWVYLAYGAAVVLTVLLPSPRTRWLGGAGLPVLALGVAASTVGEAGDAAFVRVNAALVAAGGLLVALALVRGRTVVNSAPIRPAPPSPPGAADSLVLVGILLAALAPHLLVFGAGSVLALAAAARHAVRARSIPGTVVIGLSALLLASVLAITSMILGPLGGGIATLREGPFSPPAERLLVMLAGVFVLLVPGLPPLTALPWGRALAPLAALLLVRVALPAWPGGIAEWRPLGTLLCLAMFGAAAVRGRWPSALIAGGLMAIWSGQRDAVMPGLALVGCGWVLELAEATLASRGIRLRARWSSVPAAIPALVALPALIALLRTEVLLSVLAVLILSLGLLLQFRRGSPPPLLLARGP